MNIQELDQRNNGMAGLIINGGSVFGNIKVFYALLSAIGDDGTTGFQYPDYDSERAKTFLRHTPPRSMVQANDQCDGGLWDDSQQAWWDSVSAS